jgi:hypothetical protein
LVFGQIVLGAVLRHTYSPLAPRGHLILAFGVVAGVSWLSHGVLAHREREKLLTVAIMVLLVLVPVQLLLGVEAFMLKYLASSGPAEQALVRTVHVLLGHLILATSMVVTLEVHRRAAPVAVSTSAPVSRLEGAA